jgi:branched-chain amino acid transport system ATP-binding protein
MLDVIDLKVRYGKADAVKGVTFDVAEGEIVGIIGPNGAGKSSTLRAVSGLVSVAEGQVVYGGEQIGGLKPHVISRRGLIHAPEGRRLFPRLTVEENLKVGAYSSKRKTTTSMSEVFDLFPRLAERRRQLAATLSGGEQQMLNIGRALMASPIFLMLDEPSWGLAPLVVKEIGRAILKINQSRKLSILLVEQNARLALNLSTRAYVMENGRIALSGASAELRKNPHVIEAYVGGSI